MGHLSVAELLDIPQALQPLFHDFFRRRIFVGREHFLDFLFQNVQDEFVHGFVSAGFSTFLGLFQQVALDLYFVRSKQRLPPASII